MVHSWKALAKILDAINVRAVSAESSGLCIRAWHGIRMDTQGKLRRATTSHWISNQITSGRESEAAAAAAASFRRQIRKALPKRPRDGCEAPDMEKEDSIVARLR